MVDLATKIAAFLFLAFIGLICLGVVIGVLIAICLSPIVLLDWLNRIPSKPRKVEVVEKPKTWTSMFVQWLVFCIVIAAAMVGLHFVALLFRRWF